MSDRPFWLAGEPHAPNFDLPVEDKYSDETIARVPLAGPSSIREAIEATERAFRTTRKLPTWKRIQILEQCAERLGERHAELAETLCREAGKPIRDSRVEVDRSIETFVVAAREASRLGGEVLPFDASPRGEGVTGYWKRMPLGPCSFISPFNFPLNLVAHKIAPAIAAGCPFLLKPASLTPLGALQIGEVLAETDWPAEAFSILPCRREAADLFTTDERIKLLSFTGSADVGWKLKAKAGKKRVVLELGGNAAVIVDETIRASEAAFTDAVHRIAQGAFYQSGQSCISVQRVLVHHSLYEEFRERLVDHASELRCQDPKLEETALGPIISESEAERIESWILEAVRAGARVLSGGQRSGRKIDATVMEKVPRDAQLCREEIFGPVVMLSDFHEFGDALREVNDSRYGLQAGVFTSDIHSAQRAFDELEVGGVLIGDAPSWRVDSMPYGGVKDSGLGREGPRFAIEDMTELRLFALRQQH